MNILFYTHGKVYATRGGTERTTVSVASALMRLYDCRCFSLYEAEEAVGKENCFVAEFKWQAGYDRQQDVTTLRGIIVDNGIDYIIDQGIFINVKLLSEAAEGTGCKVIFAHHYEPGAETLYMSLRRHLAKWNHTMSLRGRCRWLFDLVFYPYAKHRYDEILHRTYHEAYCHAHRVVLLSKDFMEQFEQFGRFYDSGKFSIIPNSLSFDEFLSMEEVVVKKSVALIVSRLDEVHKRLSLALRIWAQVKKDPVTKGWTLRIVGDGNDRKLYEHIIRDEHIPEVTLEGRQNPVPYYKEASIFLMTSRSESWGLTLTEAQQMGVVPIAFDTYASLREIITDGDNGVVITEGDVDGYVRRMLELMKNEELRQRMAWQAIISTQRFSQERIAEMWWKLLSRD